MTSIVVFAVYHVLWLQGFDAPFGWLSAVIGTAAFIAVFKYKISVAYVIATIYLVSTLL